MTPEPKEVWVIPHAGHLAIEKMAPQTYYRRLITFFKSALNWPVYRGDLGPT